MIVKRIRKIPSVIFTWTFVQMFHWLYYDRQYLKGRWFKKINSEGWQWAASDILHRMLFQTNKSIKWPVSPYSSYGNNILFDVDDLNNFMGTGNYFQTLNAQIVIGKGTWIARNVGIITTNHDIYNLDKHGEGKNVILGKSCWIGMNSVILPGVILGDHTIVGAGSVVTHSYPDGNCIIAGNPAKLIKLLDGETIEKECMD